MIYVRHEHCALASAMAYARKTRDVAVATVTCGPGVTQLITALPAAVRARLPMVVFAGEAPLKSGWYNQEIDQAPLITATGAVYHRLHLPERMPVEGLMILRDGEPGAPEVTLSPLRYHYQHRAEIEAVVQGADRDAAFDTLTASIGAALAADRTLGGFCDWVEAEAPRPVDLPVEGAASLKAAVIPVVLHYSTADPLA